VSISDGSLKTIEKAREYGTPVVNCLWLEEYPNNMIIINSLVA